MRMDNVVKEYEIAFLLKAEESISEVVSALKQHEGEIGAEGTLRKVVLAYPIRKMNEAFFGYCHFRLLPERVSSLDHMLQVNPAVLRFLIITPPFAKASSILSRPRQESYVRQTPSPAPAEPLPLSNEDLEKKIGEILQ